MISRKAASPPGLLTQAATYSDSSPPQEVGAKPHSGQASKARFQGKATLRRTTRLPSRTRWGQRAATSPAPSGRGSGKRARTQGLPTSPHQYPK
jgi:hypothetical protein